MPLFLGEGEGPEMEKCLDMMDSAIGSIVDELSRRPDQDRGAGDAGDETGKRTRNNTEREVHAPDMHTCLYHYVYLGLLTEGST